MTARLWRYRWCYLFVLPALVLAVMFTFYPIVASWYISLLDWTGLTREPTFIGLDNYVEAAGDPFFWRAYRRTFLFALVDVPLLVGVSLLLAIILNDQTLRLRSVFRTLFFLPVVTTTAIVGIVWSLILSPFDGPLDSLLHWAGIVSAPIDFLGDPGKALWSVVGVHVWKWVGISMIYWLVALQTIPRELYEAAQVDGARIWQQHRHITLPLIMPFGVVITLIATIGAFQAFALVQAMTEGGPFFATELIELYVYRLAFASPQPRLGYASAVAVLFGVTVMLIAVAQAWGARRVARLRAELRGEVRSEP